MEDLGEKVQDVPEAFSQLEAASLGLLEVASLTQLEAASLSQSVAVSLTLLEAASLSHLEASLKQLEGPATLTLTVEGERGLTLTIEGNNFQQEAIRFKELVWALPTAGL